MNQEALDRILRALTERERAKIAVSAVNWLANDDRLTPLVLGLSTSARAKLLSVLINPTKEAIE